MSRWVIHSVVVLICFVGFSQKQKEVWQSEKDYLEYRKSEKYKGPTDWYGSYPSSLKEEPISNPNSSGYSSQGGIKYNPQQIQRDRRERYNGFDRGGGNGDVPFDPEVERPDPLDAPDIDAPDIDAPDIDIDPPTISPAVWKFILFLLLFVALFFIAYLLIKNRKPSNKKVVVDVEDEWNPEVITKTELELRLEEAMLKEDYRECVRIYFTFILKELIRKGWINWKKEKTNYDYVLEMYKKENAHAFNECVRVYDLVWYGEYHINQEIFELLKPGFETYYKSLDPINE